MTDRFHVRRPLYPIVSILAALLTASTVFAAPAEEPAPPTVTADAAVVMDYDTGEVLYAKDADEMRVPASMTKVMTAYLIFEELEAGNLTLDTMVPISAQNARISRNAAYPMSVPLPSGGQVSVEDLLKLILVPSASASCIVMAEYIAGSEEAFVARMNQRAQELGMKNTHFVNCTGLDDSPEAASHKTTAYDIALMSRELLKNHPKIKEFTTIWMDTVRNGTFGLSNTNKLIRFYQGATGLKTGFTSSAGYCLSATAQRDGMELIAVVMGADTSQNRNAACKQLLDYGFANFALIQPELTETGDVPVRLGTQDGVPVQLGDFSGLLIDKSQKSSVTTQVTLEEVATAPVSQGQRLGTLKVLSGDQLLREIPLVAAQSVPRLTWGAMFVKVLKQVAMAKV